LIILFNLNHTPIIAGVDATNEPTRNERRVILTAKVNKLFDKCEKYTYLCIRYILGILVVFEICLWILL